MSDYFDPENSDSIGYEPEKKKKSSWWFDDYNYDYRSHTYSKGSGSRSWMSKIGYGFDAWKPKKNKNEVYQDLLNQLQNSANLIGSDDLGKVQVVWSNGNDVNRPSPNSDGSHTIFLSPDNLVSSNSSGSEVSEEILDAMTGKVYLASTLRETVSPSAFVDANSARIYPNEINNGAVTIWQAVETSIARSHILENWNGFGPYIASDAEQSSAKKSEVQDYVNSSVMNPNMDAASTAIAWNLLNSNDPIEVPDCYNDCIDAAAEVFENEINADDRFITCLELAEKINNILKQKEEEGSGSDSESDDSESDDKENNESGGAKSDLHDKSDKSDKSKGKEKPELCDGSLLGEKVENKTDAELSSQKASDEESETSGNISAKPDDKINNLGEKFELIKINPNKEYDFELKSVISNYRSEISAIRSSLKFRNTDTRLLSFGHRTGDIDDNSLFKVIMNDDRVMSRSDAVSSKKIAVCLLVDESGSMGCYSEDGNRITQARNVAIILAESLKGMEGINVSIYGHTAEEDYSNPSVAIREYYSPRQRNLVACMDMEARCQNHDSYAIMHTANLFNRDYMEHHRKIMFVISDGEPGGHGYGGLPAMKHMLKVSKACESKGIEVYGIGIDSAFSEECGKIMYGENRFVILGDVKSSLGVMSRFISQVAKK